MVKGDSMVPFSLAYTLRCRGGHYSFPWITPLTLELNLIMLSVKQGGIKYHFLRFFGMTQLGIEYQSPRPLVNTLPAKVVIFHLISHVY